MNKQNKKIILCRGCGIEKPHHAKEMCYNCYKKTLPPKMIICKNCGKNKKHHAFGLCGTCNIKLNHYHLVKAYNYKKWHNISLELYNEKTKECFVCGFDKVVDLHHLDKDHKNTDSSNFIGLCPNHHKMLHTDKYGNQIREMIRKKLEIA